MLILIAQEMEASTLVRVLDRVFEPANLFWLVAALAVVFTSIYSIIQLLVTHRERLAMIRAGMHPDAPRPTCDSDPATAKTLEKPPAEQWTEYVKSK